MGHTEQLGASIQHLTGTHHYRPAEISEDAPYKVAPTDIYALAITILVIMIQDLPFCKMTQQNLNRIYAQANSRRLFFRELFRSFRMTDERCPEEI